MANDNGVLRTLNDLENSYDGHNPDSNCVQCCAASIRLESFLDTLEGLLAKITDPNAIDELPPMLKMVSKFLPK